MINDIVITSRAMIENFIKNIEKNHFSKNWCLISIFSVDEKPIVDDCIFNEKLKNINV